MSTQSVFLDSNESILSQFIWAKFYLIGKVSKGDWRECILPTNFDTFNYGDPIDKIFGSIFFKFNGLNLECKGPRILGCDHGCSHGPNTHGIESNGCQNVNGITQEIIRQKCLLQISESDFVFAQIDDKEAFGSFFEIGFATALQKPIYLNFSSQTIADNMWFFYKGSSLVKSVTFYLDVRQAFTSAVNSFIREYR